MFFSAVQCQHRTATQQRTDEGNCSGMNDIAKPNRRKAQHASQRLRRQGEYRRVDDHEHQTQGKGIQQIRTMLPLHGHSLKSASSVWHG